MNATPKTVTPHDAPDEAAAQRDQERQVNRLPRATYRLQLRPDFDFDQIREQLDYLQALGISDLYLSPLFHARADSQHGYDVVDHNRIEPSFGNRRTLQMLADEARRRDMGLLLDIVPNHMGINDADNQLWNDVLENGPTAQSAMFFDIDWNPPGGELVNCVLLPFLGKPFGETLEAGELKIVKIDDGFTLTYFERRFPLNPVSWINILELASQQLPSEIDAIYRDELASIIMQLTQIPTCGDSVARYREQTIARRRLREWIVASRVGGHALDAALTQINGTVGHPHSFDTLEQVLREQYYQLAYWQVAVDEINYRRFFDINDLAAVRVENDSVFDHLHLLTWELVKSGVVTGLRVDHIDGLLDPESYLDRLQSSYRSNLDSDCAADLYVIVEKILSDGETLPSSWRVSGTTGYEFLNSVSLVMINDEGLVQLHEQYGRLVGRADRPRDVVYHGKQNILHDAMASELFVLASRLFRIARMNRRTTHFTLRGLLQSLREVIACFPVYRSYVRPHGWDVDDQDHRRIRESIRWAMIRNPTTPRSLFEFISNVLLLEFPPGLDECQQSHWRDWVLRFQQVTGPVTAKGIEDTSFYRYYPLLSLNEVGGELDSKALSVDRFHQTMIDRARDWPRSMSTTATHDTKRGEDMRARLHVLSECPQDFAKAFNAWGHAVNLGADTFASIDINERYFIFQTILGTWPHDECDWRHYRDRLHAYFQKAFREAKLKTSWRSPNPDFELAVANFVDLSIQDHSKEAFGVVDEFAKLIAGPGFVNSLSQVILKATLPGVPDFYQGSELWNFYLVDPDNRQPVDFGLRADRLRMLQELDSRPGAMMQNFEDRVSNESLKIAITRRVLNSRRDHWDVFASGNYRPLHVTGEKARNVIAFLRQYHDRSILVAVPRLPLGLVGDGAQRMAINSYLADAWGDTAIHLESEDAAQWHDGITSRDIEVSNGQIPLAELFSTFCGAVLVARGMG